MRSIRLCLLVLGFGCGFLLSDTASAQGVTQVSEHSQMPVNGVDLVDPRSPFLPQATSPTVRRFLRRNNDPFSYLSQASLLATLRDLTGIRPYRMWRTAGSQGEADARVYVKSRLEALTRLQGMGLSIEVQPFRTFLGGDIRDARVELTWAGHTVAVQASGLQGNREVLSYALRFDSDGSSADSDPNPVSRTGATVFIRTAADMTRLSASNVRGRIVFVDYSVVDSTIQDANQAGTRAWQILSFDPAAVVIVTSFSNVNGQSHGTFVSSGSVFTSLDGVPAPPTLFVRMEDLVPFDITSWSDLAAVTSATVFWDADVYSPASSANIIAKIPGADPSRAMILGAHLDSPNTPGAMDNGSGSAVLLEIAKALDATGVQPPIDLYLIWYGSHERGLYGSANFIPAHGEILDRVVAMQQVDCLTRPIVGLNSVLTLEAWTYARFGDARLAWPDYLRSIAGDRGIFPYPLQTNGIVSDNSSFVGLNVPNSNLIYLDPNSPIEVHYSGHLHDPYDTVELASEVASTLEQMAVVALTAAMSPPENSASVRVTPPADRRVLFVASHTQAPHMSPVGFTEFGMTLGWEGFHLDFVPYGREITSADLVGADMVVVLPIIDLENPTQPGKRVTWTASEIEALRDYVGNGGFLLLTNSAHRLKYRNFAYEDNGNWSSANSLASVFGVTFQSGEITGNTAYASGSHPLRDGVTSLEVAANNSVPFTFTSGQSLASMGARTVMALAPCGTNGGEVLVLGDVGILGTAQNEGRNLTFWRNLATYARSR